MYTKTCLYSLLLITVLSSCGNNNSENKNDGTGESQTSTAPATNENKNPTATIHVVVTGGARAGTYDAVCQTACCSYGIAGEKIFGNQYSESGKKPEEFSSLQLVVEDVTGNKRTTEFLASVSFGDMMTKEYKTYTIDTHKGSKSGSGTLDLQYANNKGTVRIKGTTADGVGLDITLDCTKVYTTEMLMQEAQEENE